MKVFFRSVLVFDHSSITLNTSPFNVVLVVF